MKIQLMTASGIPENLSNLCPLNNKNINKITDTISNSKSAKEMAYKLNNLGLLRKFRFERETATYIRLIANDWMGNTSYLKITK